MQTFLQQQLEINSEDITSDNTIGCAMVEIDASGPGLVRLITRLDGNVTPHYHLVGDENYYILEGEGQLEYSLVVDEESAFLEVRAGDSFLIPVGRGPFSARKADICF